MTEPNATSESPILVQLGSIAELTLNRPRQANALTWSMGEALSDAVERVNAHDSVRVVLVRGAGRHFSGGGDFAFIEQNAEREPDEVEAIMRRFYGMYLRLLDLRAPTIAVVQGSAVGAGLCVALACDLRVGSRTAKLGANFVRIGLHPGMGATALLPELCGPGPAAELLLTGQFVSGSRAFELGLLTQAVDEALVDSAVRAQAEAITKGSARAIAETTETLRAPLKARLHAALAREAQCQAGDFGSDDVRRAIETFRSRAKPA